MNGTRILQREVADDIHSLEGVQAPKSCRAFGLVRSALVRSLRLGEDARHVARQNRGLLIALVLLNLLGDHAEVGELILAALKFLGR